MKKSFIFKQYVWLVDTIRRARRISLADLSECWQRSDLSEGKPLSRTTFNRHRDAVEEIFGIAIACDADNRYYIVDNELFRTDAVQQWMLSTLTVSNTVGGTRHLPSTTPVGRGQGGARKDGIAWRFLRSLCENLGDKA